MLVNGSRTQAVITGVSIIANFFVLLLLGRRKSKLTFNLKIVGLIAIFDTLSSILFLTFSIMNLTSSLDAILYCQVMGALGCFTLAISCILVGFLTVERYYIVKYGRDIDVKKCSIILSSILLLVFIPAIVLAANNSFALAPTLGYCIPKNSTFGYLYKAFITLILLIILPTITYCYISIIFILKRTVKQNVNLITTENKGESNNEHGKKRKISDIFVILRSIAIVISYNLCILPILISNIWASVSPSTRPLELDRIGAIALFFVLLVNPLMILGLHSKLSKDFLNLFIFFRK